MVSRAAATSAGSSESASMTWPSGMGCTHVFSGRVTPRKDSTVPAGPRSIGVGRPRRPPRRGPPLAAPQLVEADVGGDAVEPGPHGRAAFEPVQALPGPDHGLLDG